MRKFNLLMSLLMMVGLIAAGSAFGAGMNEHDSSMMNQPNSNQMLKGSLDHPFDLSYLLHKSVKNEQGHKIGTISDVVMGPDGQAQFVIISRSGGVLSSSKFIPVPWKTFSSNWKNSTELSQSRPIELSLAQSRLDRAPDFTNRRDLTKNATRQKVCQFFKGDCAQNMLDHHPQS
jgi:sporulation protein YlmC with PRC-barrel domain